LKQVLQILCLYQLLIIKIEDQFTLDALTEREEMQLKSLIVRAL